MPAVFNAKESIQPGAPIIHEEKPDNIISSFGANIGDIDEEIKNADYIFTGEYETSAVQHCHMENQSAYAYKNIISSFGANIGDIDEEIKNADYIFTGEYETSAVQHCHMENQSAYAYKDSSDRIVIVTSTQIPHIVRRIVAQALGLPWGKVRVIKPYIGGGFGNKQDVTIEPLTAAMSLAVNGEPVRLTLTREEVFVDTRTRHAMLFNIKTAVSKDGYLKGIYMSNLVNNGAYASHGHSIAMSAASKFRPLYNFSAIKVEPKTIYTNLPVAGAMRGYGIPQICFALESHLDDIAKSLNIDPIEFREKNFINIGHTDKLSNLVVRSFGLKECVKKGKELINWNEKKEKYKNQSSDKRRGLGMACFSYFSGTHPVKSKFR